MKKAASAQSGPSEQQLYLLMSEVISLREQVAQAELTARAMELSPSDGDEPNRRHVKLKDHHQATVDRH